MRSVLRIIVGDGLMHRAVEHLRQRGLAARPNGIGLYVEVAPRDKAAPIRMLAEASIAVHDFELIANQSESPQGGRHDHA
jgi:hypothetical protein